MRVLRNGTFCSRKQIYKLYFETKCVSPEAYCYRKGCNCDSLIVTVKSTTFCGDKVLESFFSVVWNVPDYSLRDTELVPRWAKALPPLHIRTEFSLWYVSSTEWKPLHHNSRLVPGYWWHIKPQIAYKKHGGVMFGYRAFSLWSATRISQIPSAIWIRSFVEHNPYLKSFTSPKDSTISCLLIAGECCV